VDMDHRRGGRSSGDLQLLRLEEDGPGRASEYLKVGNSEVMTLESRGGATGQVKRRRGKEETYDKKSSSAGSGAEASPVGRVPVQRRERGALHRPRAGGSVLNVNIGAKPDKEAGAIVRRQLKHQALC
jgi:hypothetical protein